MSARKYRHNCIRCGREFTTRDIGSYYCSRAHRELGNAGTAQDKVQVTFTSIEKKRWDRNLERFANARHRNKLTFGRGTRARPGWRREQPSVAKAV